MDGILELPEKWIPCNYQLRRVRIKHSSSDLPGWSLEFMTHKLHGSRSLNLMSTAQHAAELVLTEQEGMKEALYSDHCTSLPPGLF